MRLERSAAGGVPGALVFQFHKGAIRTLIRSALNSFLINFNSIKVRLEQTSFKEAFGDFPYFNSIKVRLELTYAATHNDTQ